MNRERILFLSVLALLALWFFVLRAPPTVAGQVSPGTISVTLLDVPPTLRTERRIQPAKVPLFVPASNEKPAPRARLDLPAERSIPCVWPPTFFSVSAERLGLLRRPLPAPGDAAASLVLPEMPAGPASTEAAGGGGAARVDTWTTYNKAASRIRGSITGIVKQGERRPLRAPKEHAAIPAIEDFDRLLALLEIDPDRAQQMGVTAVEVRFQEGGSLLFDFPKDIQNFKIAEEGADAGYWEALREYLKLPAQGYDVRVSLGRRLLEMGTERKDRSILQWAMACLEEARAQVPPDVQETLKQILLLMIECATKLNQQERILDLSFQHLSRFPDEPLVCEYLGSLMESRSFNLPLEAAAWYARASSSKRAQRMRAGVLVRLGQLDEAAELLQSGRVESGPETDLLLARIALARADFAGARDRARAHTGGKQAAEALQILGAADYAEGRADEAEKRFLAAVQADPGRSTAYSDLGLALAAQGKAADARVCFERALRLDSVDNAVLPRIGDAVLKLAAQDLDGGQGILGDLLAKNQSDPLVAYYVAYAKERSGDLEGAAAGYRSILDRDYRSRFVIAHLGVVQARRAELGAGEEIEREAVAFLQKALAVQRDEPTLHYVLARHLLFAGQQPGLAEKLFARIRDRGVPAPAWDGDLPLWAAAGGAALLYQAADHEPADALAAFNGVRKMVQDLPRYRNNPKDAEKDPVFLYAGICSDRIKDASRRFDRNFDFPQRPKDWKVINLAPMVISFRDGRVEFKGRFDFKGAARKPKEMLEFCALQYPDRAGAGGGTILSGETFEEVVFTGVCPRDSTPSAELGVGLVVQDRLGPKGVQVKLDHNTGLAAIRLDGGKDEVFKGLKGEGYRLVEGVPWPADGKFEIRIKVEDRKNGQISVTLNGVNLFQALKIGDAESCLPIQTGQAKNPLTLVVWVEGSEGDAFQEIFLDKVTLTMSKK